MGTSTSSSRLKNDNLSVKSFSEQTKDLLAEIKTIKEIQREPIDPQEDYNDYYQPSTHSKYSLPHRPMNKSSSVSHLGARGLGLRRNGSGTGTRDDDSESKSTRSRKHVLKLKNLEMVPCQNEYY